MVHEIVNTGADFVLHVPDDVPNFTEYREGALIWTGDGREYRVHGEPQYIVFPNRDVKPGQRAGLMVRGDGVR